jgi:hypothetical protein
MSPSSVLYERNHDVPPIKSGVDLMNALEAEAVEYFKVRRLQVKSLAKLKATTEVEILIFPMIENNASDLDAVYLKDAVSIEWLTNLMVSVQPDSKKLEEAVAYLKKHFNGRVQSKPLDDLVKQFLAYVKEDFNAMRGMKQSIYYRSRSLNSIFRFFDICENSVRNEALRNNQDIQAYLNKIKENFLLQAEGERYTKNSYLAEFFSFVSDVQPSYLPDSELGAIKSLDDKFNQSVSNLKSLSLSNRIVRTAYEQFRSLLPENPTIDKNYGDASNLSEDFTQKAHGEDSVQIHLRKGEGVEISFKSASKSISRIAQLEEALLLELFKKKDAPDISIDSSQAKNGELSLFCGENTTPAALLDLRKLLLALAAKI